MNKASRNRLILLGFVVVLALVYFLVPGVKSWINTSVSTLFTMDLDSVIDYIRGFGGYAVAVSFFLMILQSIIAPIPAFVITLSNAVIWGWWRGAILSWTSSMVGAAMCFYIARIIGRDIVIKLNSNTAVENIEKFFDRYGTNAILIARLLPFVPFDPVSYFAGLTPMDFWKFFIATGIGQLPATVVYSYGGAQLTGGAKGLFIGLLILFGGSAVVAMLKKMYDAKQKNNEKKDSTKNI